MMMELCGRKYPVKQELSCKAEIVLFNESISRGKNSQTVCADCPLIFINMACFLPKIFQAWREMTPDPRDFILPCRKTKVKQNPVGTKIAYLFNL